MNTINFVNCTAHEIRLNDGRVFPPSGIVARVSAKCTGFDSNGIATIKYEEVNLPLAIPNTIYIVSEIVKVAEPQRDDFVCPAYGCKDAVYVNGQIVSVPGFIR